MTSYSCLLVIFIFANLYTALTLKAPRVSFILGPPLAGRKHTCFSRLISKTVFIGKGTQATKLVSEFGVVHLSAGDLLRSEREKGTALADTIERLNKIKIG